jgi:hypothetical protein
MKRLAAMHAFFHLDPARPPALIMGVRLVIPNSVLAQLPRGRPKAAAVAPR